MRRTDSTRIRLVLERSAHFGKLPHRLRDQLVAISRLYHARPDERLDSSQHRHSLFIVVSGAVRISTHPIPRNGECVHAVIGRGSYFGLAGAVGAASNVYSARAVGPTDLAIVDGERLAAALDQHPRLWRRVSSLLAERLKLIIDSVADNALLPPPQRAVRCLLSHATSIELNEGAQPTVLMTQTDLARIIGIARSKVNHVLKGLEGHGLVRTGYGKITLLDLPALRKVAGREVEPL